MCDAQRSVLCVVIGVLRGVSAGGGGSRRG